MLSSDDDENVTFFDAVENEEQLKELKLKSEPKRDTSRSKIKKYANSSIFDTPDAKSKKSSMSTKSAAYDIRSKKSFFSNRSPPIETVTRNNPSSNYGTSHRKHTHGSRSVSRSPSSELDTRSLHDFSGRSGKSSSRGHHRSQTVTNGTNRRTRLETESSSHHPRPAIGKRTDETDSLKRQETRILDARNGTLANKLTLDTSSDSETDSFSTTSPSSQHVTDDDFFDFEDPRDSEGKKDTKKADDFSNAKTFEKIRIERCCCQGWSPDGLYLAVGDQLGCITIFKRSTTLFYTPKKRDKKRFFEEKVMKLEGHSAPVTCISWNNVSFTIIMPSTLNYYSFTCSRTHTQKKLITAFLNF